jgi:hypothetical protein
VPFVSPVTERGLADPEAVIEPGIHVAVYAVIGDPPLEGAVNVTAAEPFPGVAVPIAGAAGDVLYVRAAGFVSNPLLVGVRVTGRQMSA